MIQLPKIDPKQIKNLPESLTKLDNMVEIKSIDQESLRLDESKRLTVIGNSSGGVNKKYVDDQDLSILNQAKQYTNGEKSSLSTVAITGNYQDLSNKPNLKPVATTGSYNDLEDKPVSLGGKTVLVTEVSDLPAEPEDGVTYLVKDSDIFKSLVDIFHPIGEYYETSALDFDPNVSWGGVWEEIKDGRVLVSLDDNSNEFNIVGKTGGSTTHRLNINEMPSHKHSIRYENGAGVSISTNNRGPNVLNVENFAWRQNETPSDEKGSNIFGDFVGNNQPHNNLQPYIVVKRWHRTA